MPGISLASVAENAKGESVDAIRPGFLAGSREEAITQALGVNEVSVTPDYAPRAPLIPNIEEIHTKELSSSYALPSTESSRARISLHL